MAKQTTVTIVDDIDGSAGAEQIDFGFDGRTYEIDLSAENAARLRDVLAPYVSAARRTSAAPRRTGTTASAPRPGTDRERNQAVREWAGQNGFKIAERGRIPSNVLEAYDNAH